jgi:hypothetical protein
MKRLISAIAILLGWASAGWAAAPTPLTTLQAIKAMTNAEASKELPVAFEATVTYFRGYENMMFVQDGVYPIYLRIPAIPALAPGDRVLVTGKARREFQPLSYCQQCSLAPPRRPAQTCSSRIQ